MSFSSIILSITCCLLLLSKSMPVVGNRCATTGKRGLTNFVVFPRFCSHSGWVLALVAVSGSANLTTVTLPPSRMPPRRTLQSLPRLPAMPDAPPRCQSRLCRRLTVRTNRDSLPRTGGHQSGMFEPSPFKGYLISPSYQASSATLVCNPCLHLWSVTLFMTHLVSTLSQPTSPPHLINPLTPPSFSIPRSRRFEYQDIDFIPRHPERSSAAGPS